MVPANPIIAGTWRRLIGAATLAAVALVVAAPATSAELTLNGTLYTPLKLDASTHFILYYLEMHTGATAEVFSVTMAAPPFATAGGIDEGQSIDGPTAIALQGPGTLGQLVQSPSVITACSSRQSAFHGYATGTASIDVLLPANSATTLAVRYDTGRRAPWVDSDFRLTFTVTGKLVGSYAAASPFSAAPTVTSRMTMTTAGPVVAGRTGAHILLSTTPQGTPGTPFAPRVVGRGQAIGIGGRLLPGDGGRRIILRWARDGGPLRTLAAVRTATGGTFQSGGVETGRSGDL